MAAPKRRFPAEPTVRQVPRRHRILHHTRHAAPDLVLHRRRQPALDPAGLTDAVVDPPSSGTARREWVVAAWQNRLHDGLRDPLSLTLVAVSGRGDLDERPDQG